MITYWAPGPVSHPYPSVSNCRTQETLEGRVGIPVLGLPDCSRDAPQLPVSLPVENLKMHGIPVPDHYDAPSFTAVEENLRLQLQVVRLGDVVLGSCACEAQVDLILNFETRADDVEGNIHNGFPWDEHCDDRGDGTWACPNPGAHDLADRSLDRRRRSLPADAGPDPQRRRRLGRPRLRALRQQRADRPVADQGQLHPRGALGRRRVPHRRRRRPRR
jgi:hypothetical protein